MTLDEPLVGGIAARLRRPHTWTARGDNGALTDHRVTDMTLHHQARVLAWLRLHADALHAEHRADMDRAWMRGRVTTYEHRQQVRAHDAVTPAVWLEETALVRRLVQLVPRRPAPARGLLRWWSR